LAAGEEEASIMAVRNKAVASPELNCSKTEEARRRSSSLVSSEARTVVDVAIAPIPAIPTTAFLAVRLANNGRKTAVLARIIV